MEERSTTLSRDQLISFLDFAGNRGLINKGTAAARAIACNSILGILDETEASDLSKINMEEVIRRHRNLAAGKIAPRTLRTYESRVQIAVNDFIEYTKDPSSWKPAVKQQKRKAPKTVPSAKKSRIGGLVGKPEEFGKGEVASQPSVHIDFQIHISPDATPEQIEQIFDSISRHLYPNRTGK